MPIDATMETADSTFLSDIGLRVAATFLALIGAFIARRLWQKATKEYDRSMLIRLGTAKDSPGYANAPIIVGQFPFSELGGRVRSNLDSRNVIGFVVGEPKWLDIDALNSLGISLDSESHKPGYYAYCVIQWEHAATVKRFADQWFHIRRTSYYGNRAEEGMRERIFIGFGTDSKPDPGTTDTRPIVAHIKDGLLASFQYQPYLKGGFRAADIKMRALAPQTRALIWCKNLITKEWKNA